MTVPRITTFLCLIVLCGILAAGLSPFHVPRNAVSWLPDADGLRFDRYGSVISAQPVPDGPGEACSLEVWMQPTGKRSAATVLAFYTPETPRRFELLQLDDDLVIGGNTLSEENPARIAWLRFPHALRLNQPILITMTAGQRTSIYINGALVKTHEFRFLRSNFMGQMVLGTSPFFDQGWIGQIRGVALFDRELAAVEVALRYRSWTNGQPEVSGASHFYRFNERSGEIVSDAVSPGIHLDIPPRYTVLHHAFLESPWKEFNNEWGYWKDVLVNIGGFIPFGFLFGVYLSSAKPVRRPILTTILLGAVVTFFIEITQAWLPTRDSSMTDVLMNILGTVIGAALQGSKPIRSVYDWLLNAVVCLTSGHRTVP
jgi:hypothetical protein